MHACTTRDTLLCRQAAEGEPEWREHEQQEEEEEEEPVHARVRQPVVPTELTLAGEVALPPGGRITLSNPNPAQGPAADGEGNGEGAAPVLPCLPAALAVIALGTEGEPVPAEDLRPLQLHYERQDLVGMGLTLLGAAVLRSGMLVAGPAKPLGWTHLPQGVWRCGGRWRGGLKR